MPSKKKKYNARFPAGRIKKIMQTDEEVGKVAQAVPVIISRTLELFVESLLTKTLRITNARNAKTLSPSHMKQCIISESRFDFLRDLVKNIPDIGVNEEQLSGSEAGETAAPSPASTSTSSSSNGGHAVVATSDRAVAGSSSSTGHSVVLQRSESYTPASSSSSYAGHLPVQISAQQHQQQTSSHQSQQSGNLKRALNHVGFYKEISLEETSSSSGSGGGRAREPPPPKLTRLHSAPAASATLVSTPTTIVPFKIDILPTGLPVTATPSGTTSSSNAGGGQLAGRCAGGPATAGNYKILCSYKIDPVTRRELPPAPLTPTPSTSGVNLQQPVFKLDYSNLKLPMSTAAPDSHQSKQQQQPHSASARHHPLQPTIKIDLSNITNFGSTTPSSPLAGPRGAGIATPPCPSVITVKQVPLSSGSSSSSGNSSASSTPSTPLSATSFSSGMSSSHRYPYVFQPSSSSSATATSSSASSSAAAAAATTSSAAAPPPSTAPLYSGVSSTIPGMDEDYDDI